MTRRRLDLRTRAAQRVGGLLALALVAGGAVALQELQGQDGSGPSQVVQAPAPQVQPRQDAPADGLPTVSAAALPPQARETLALIDAGGPFPYRQDGGVFGNRERLLPSQPRGCYREYTVETPGEDDRGARRIVTSCAGPRYWTADHYESFARITAARL